MRHQYAFPTAGAKSQPARYRFETAGYDQMQVIVVNRGVLHFASGERREALGPGGVALLRRGSAFALFTGAESYGGVFVTEREEEDAFVGQADAFFGSAELRDLAGHMQREIDAAETDSTEVVGGLGRAVLRMAMRESARRIHSATREDVSRYWAERARQALDLTLCAGSGPREAFAGLGLSYRQISRYFQDVYEKSPKAYQLEARVREAQTLLARTSLPVTAIAFRLGYASSQRFATQFRAVAGVSPSEFRAHQNHAFPAG